LFGVVFVAQICFEGLLRPRLIVLSSTALVLATLAAAQWAEHLPLVVQRTIAFLPINVNPVVRQSVDNSSDWRYEMWQTLLPEVPTYLLKGKGYGFDPHEMEFMAENTRRGYDRSYTEFILSGEYHSGPLSIVIPFGVWGFLVFGWFIVAAIQFLYRQYRDGSPALRSINTFLLAYFVARLVVFLFIYGAFHYDFFIFTGLLGLSVSLNGAAPATEPKPAETEESLAFGETFGAERLRSS
jgi:hypothetical protein